MVITPMVMVMSIVHRGDDGNDRDGGGGGGDYVDVGDYDCDGTPS